MDERYKYLYKNVGILAISNFASKILVFLLVPLYTSVLTEKEYGIYDLTISVISLLYPILTANIADAVMRFSMDPAYPKEDTASIGLKYICISIFIFALGLSVMRYFHVFPDLRGFHAYVFLYYFFYVLNQYFIQLAKGLERVKDMGIAGVISTVAMIGANVLFLLVLKRGLPGFFFANIVGQAISVLFYMIRLRLWTILKKLRNNHALERRMLAYSVPSICTTLGWWANSSADKYTVAIICGVAANGILSVAYKIPSIIIVLQSFFIQAWQISAVKEYGSADMGEYYGKTFIRHNFLMSLVCSVLILASRPLARIFFANNFYAAWQYIPFLLISSLINCASGFMGSIFSAKKDSKSMAISAVHGTAVNILLNILLVYLIGIQGATIATVISSFTIYLIRKRRTKGCLYVDSHWKVLFTWALLCLQACLEIYTSLWYVEIIIFVGLLFLNKGIVMKAMQKIHAKITMSV